jgi:hypothetical protein
MKALASESRMPRLPGLSPARHRCSCSGAGRTRGADGSHGVCCRIACQSSGGVRDLPCSRSRFGPVVSSNVDRAVAIAEVPRPLLGSHDSATPRPRLSSLPLDGSRYGASPAASRAAPSVRWKVTRLGLPSVNEHTDHSVISIGVPLAVPLARIVCAIR